MAVTTDVVYETGVELVQSACSKMLAHALQQLLFFHSKVLLLLESAKHSEIPEQVSRTKCGLPNKDLERKDPAYPCA